MKNAFALAFSSLRARPLFAGLAALSVATAIMLLCLLMLLAQSVQDGITRNAGGVDVIVGAKGSKLQLVLSSLYHLDIPNGNIDAHVLAQLQRNKQIKTLIPLAMGDSYRGHRVVGTTADYPALYNAKVGAGRMFEKPFEVVAGAATGMAVGQKFAAVHGFSALGQDAHDAHLYEVVGTMSATGTVLDGLLLTPLESVQELHAHHDGYAGHHDHDAHDDDDDMAHQITAILIKVKSPAAVLNLPRQINRGDDAMAANPSYQMARLLGGIGVGKRVSLVLAAMMLGLSFIMLFAMLASGLAARQYDLAVLRVLGARPYVLFVTVLTEGLIIGLAGAGVGILAGHGMAYMLTINVDLLGSLVAPQSLLAPGMADLVLLATGALAGAAAALLPAISASRLDIGRLLANR